MIRSNPIVLLFFIMLYALPVRGGEYSIETVPNVRLSNRYNYVSNPDGIISTADANRINQILRQLEDSLSIEVAVVALESIGDNDARMFATDLFQKWGIGKKEDDNGLLIQLITESSQRSVVFETGYGLEGVLPDAICYRLQQRYMIPDMREGNFSSGMVKGVEAVAEYLKASDYERADIAGTGNIADEDFPIILLFLIFFFPALILIVSLVANQWKHRKKRCPNCGKRTFSYVRTQTIQAATYRSQGIAEDIYICSNCGYTERIRKNINRLRGGGGGPVIFGGGMGGLGGGGGSFGGGGGFGGSFGGGRSGGGGSISRF